MQTVHGALGGSGNNRSRFWNRSRSGDWVGGCRRGCHLTRSTAISHLDIRSTVALLAFHLTVVLVLLAAVARGRAFSWLVLDSHLGWCRPSWNLPNCETLESEATLLPFPARFASSIESSKSSIDSTLICLRTEFVSGAICGSRRGGGVVN
jgi:hypothetical protein